MCQSGYCTGPNSRFLKPSTSYSHLPCLLPKQETQGKSTTPDASNLGSLPWEGELGPPSCFPVLCVGLLIVYMIALLKDLPLRTSN